MRPAQYQEELSQLKEELLQNRIDIQNLTSQLNHTYKNSQLDMTSQSGLMKADMDHLSLDNNPNETYSKTFCESSKWDMKSNERPSHLRKGSLVIDNKSAEYE